MTDNGSPDVRTPAEDDGVERALPTPGEPPPPEARFASDAGGDGVSEDSAVDALDTIDTQVSQIAALMRTSIRQGPLTAVLAAFALGMLIGRLR